MFGKYRSRILLAFSFVIVERIAWILEPTVFGDVIDAMIEALAVPPKGLPQFLYLSGSEYFPSTRALAPIHGSVMSISI
jgi:hypothetical protein